MHGHSTFILRFTLFAACHSLFATKRIKQLVARATGREIRSYRLLYNLLSIVVFGWVMAADRHSAVLYYVPGSWSLVLYLLQAVVALLLIGCVRQTGLGDFFGIRQIKNGSGPDNRLVTTGYYSIVRHPLYLLSSIFLALNPVMTEQWLILAILSLAYFICGGLIEEQRLVDEFGESYRSYRNRVPFMIPSLRRFRPPGA